MPTAKPTTEMLAQLSRKERALFGIARAVNDSPRLKRGIYHYLRVIGAGWVHPLIRSSLCLHGLEHVRDLRPDEPVLLVANHQSYFDLFVVLDVVLRETRLGQNGLYFPVRSNYYYDHAMGLALNAGIAGLSLFPPVFRDNEKKEFNRYTLDYLIDLCRTPGALIGFHPEGTRNKSGDPYNLLPAQPGVGRMVLEARPRVLPVFVNGLSNNFGKQAVAGLLGKADPLYVVFGKPLDLDEFEGMASEPATHKKIAARFRDVLMALGQEEKRLRVAAGHPVPGPAAPPPAPPATETVRDRTRKGRRRTRRDEART